MEPDHIVVRGARQHNLKNITVRIPKKRLVVLSGVSGSGKSSLALDTLYAEGQRRYVESLSSYARQFLGQMDKPLYDTIQGLSPTISVDQKSSSHNPRSTVGTITEISDYLRVLFARAGEARCPRCERPVRPQSAQEIVDELAGLPVGARFVLLAPVLQNRKGEFRGVLESILRRGFSRARIDGSIRLVEEVEALDKRKKHTIEIVVDRLKRRDPVDEDWRERATDSVETALREGEGILLASVESRPEGGGAPTWEDRIFSERNGCPACGIGFPDLTPQLFSFNSPQGMCEKCNGLGGRAEVDEDLVAPDSRLSVNAGAVVPWGVIAEKDSWESAVVRAAGQHFRIDLNRPFGKLAPAKRRILLWGEGRDRKPKWVRVPWREGVRHAAWEGVMNQLRRRMRETHSGRARRYYGRFFSTRTCRACGGSRLRPEALSVRVGGRTIAELSALAIDEALAFVENLRLEGAAFVIGAELLKEIGNRLRFLTDVGLGYLSLARLAPSLSGGESQRIRLASQIGSELTGVIYILDEPSIGLHPRDGGRLLAALRRLRDVGNTVVVVEHDRETIEAADHVVDFGPGAGIYGGEVVAEGPPDAIRSCRESLTGRYLAGELEIPVPAERRRSAKRLRIRGARANNLKRVDAVIPLGTFVAVTGVSGAGKSTLVYEVLYRAVARALHRSEKSVGAHRRIEGLDQINRVVDIDQSPIGRTPRSNPATYTKVFDGIRQLFAALPASRAAGYKPGRFSFNVAGGRCEHCSGDGVIRVEMHFLADVFVACEVCGGRRFNDQTLTVRYQGLSIAEVLDLSVREAVEVFRAQPGIARILHTLLDVGLGYIRLGQPSPTLSGGEAQRVKLSRELAKRATGDTLYILDEPTTGLHFDDISRLLQVLHRLVRAGNTVVVIEHNLDVIKTADHVLDLGPEGGAAGGRVVAAGTPEEVAGVPESHTGRYLRDIVLPAARRVS